MNENVLLSDGAASLNGTYEGLSEQMELESLRYSRALPEEEEARQR